MFQTLALENFTAFKETSFEWSPGVNVLIGANGTGKTHIMKLMYALQMQGHDAAELKKKLAAVFRPSGDKVSRLVNRKKGSNTARISLSNSAAQSLSLTFDTTRHHTFELQGEWAVERSPVFIPVKEVLSFAPGFISLYDKYELAFEEVYYDIIKQCCFDSTA